MQRAAGTVALVAALSAFGALAAVLPRECGIADGPLEALFLQHPRAGFFVAIGVVLVFTSAVLRSIEGPLRTLPPSRFIPLALVSWASFEALQYFESIPGRSAFEYREGLLWMVLFLVAGVSFGARGPNHERGAVELP